MDEMQFPDWQELVLTVAVEQQDEALAQLVLCGFEQAWIEQPIEHLRTPDGWAPSPRDPQHVSIHLYCDPDDLQAADRVREALGDLVGEISAATLPTENWIDQWRHGRRVVALRDGWVLCPPWLLDDAPDRERAVVIDPGLAFGAGDHPTTQDCGRLIISLTQPGDRVLDLGAGSGVLSILAMKLGAESAVAVEIDALAAGEIPRNAALNGVEGLTVHQADATQTPLDGPFDLIMANIGAGELRRIASFCTGLAKPGSRLILSGLVDWAADEVAAGYEALGWTLVERVQGSTEWVTIALRLP